MSKTVFIVLNKKDHVNASCYIIVIVMVYVTFEIDLYLFFSFIILLLVSFSNKKHNFVLLLFSCVIISGLVVSTF